MPTRKDQLAASLRKSLNEEEKSVQDRFERAEAMLGGSPETPSEALKEKSAEPIEVRKVIRDAFTMPMDDHALFETLKGRALALGLIVNKSELVRAGIKVLADMDDSGFQNALDKVERIKAGRPKQ